MITNNYGSVTSAVATLVVQGEPRILSQPSNQYALPTRNAGLGSTVLEDRPPTKSTPAKTAPTAPKQPTTVPITVTPEGGKPQTIQIPVQSAPPGQQAPAQPAPAQKK